MLHVYPYKTNAYESFSVSFAGRTNRLCDCFLRRYRGEEQWKEAEEKQKEASVYHRKLHEVLLKKKAIYIQIDQYPL